MSYIFYYYYYYKITARFLKQFIQVLSPQSAFFLVCCVLFRFYHSDLPNIAMFKLLMYEMYVCLQLD